MNLITSTLIDFPLSFYSGLKFDWRRFQNRQFRLKRKKFHGLQFTLKPEWSQILHSDEVL
jgi:hypothetical protein